MSKILKTFQGKIKFMIPELEKRERKKKNEKENYVKKNGKENVENNDNTPTPPPPTDYIIKNLVCCE